MMTDHDAPLSDEQIADVRRVRRFRTADVVADGVPTPVKLIIDGRDGSLVFPADHAMLEADELVMWLPAERFDAVQVLADRSEVEDPYDEAKDRYLAYHGEHRGRHGPPRWARCAAETIRVGSRVWSNDEAPLINRLRADEPRLCKLLNADRDRLGGLCEDMVDVRPPSPLAVGVDEDGIDVRGSIGIIRLEFPRRARDGVDAGAMLRGLLKPGLAS